MAKEEIQKLNEITELVKSLQSQLNFLQVQLGSAGPRGGASPGSGQQVKQAGGASIDPKQFQVIEHRLNEIIEVESRNSELLYGIREDLNRLVTGKIEAADERLNQVTSLLEQGLKLTEMGTSLTEIRDKLEEIIFELEANAKNVAPEE